MKVWAFSALVVAISANLAFGGDGVELKNKKDKISYGIGVSMGTNLKGNLKQDDLDVSNDLILRGMKDVLTGVTPAMTDNEVRETLTALQTELQAKAEERTKLATEKNKKEGEAFLAENKKKDGIVTLPSGLQYKVIKEGDGAIPKATDMVETNYKGTLIDGTEFDSSYKRGQAATFPVNGVIPGWTEALQKMKVGSKWQLFVPSELAYGPKGAGNIIGPNATLVFEVELLSVKEADKSGKGMPGMGGMGGGGMHGH